MGLDETSSVAYNSGEPQTDQTSNYFVLLFSRDRLAIKFLASVWQGELGNYDVLKLCYIKIYAATFLLCNEKAVNLQHM